MRRCGPVKEVYELAALTGVLVRQCGQPAAARQYCLDSGEVVVLIEDTLPGPLAEAAQEIFEPEVVQPSSDGVGTKAQQAQTVASQLPVAQMPGEEHHRLLVKQCLNQWAGT